MMLVAGTGISSSSAMETDDCLECHGDSSIIDEGGERLYVDGAQFAGTKHAEDGCGSCHSVTDDHPDDGLKPGKESCDMCHEDTIEELITAWEADGGTFLSFDEDYPDYIVGYVTSSDKTGNFYKELYIQDDPTNPTAAIKLNIALSDMYTKYNVGRKLFIYMKGLGIGVSHGELVIQEIGDGSGVSIRENVAKRNIIRSCDVFEVTPLALTSPSEVNDLLLGSFVEFSNMQFDLSLVGEDFVDELDSYDSHRAITNCEDNSYIKLETSTYADFKNVALPTGQGTVRGIIGRDYGDDFYVLRVNGVDAFDFEGERCDPDMLDCGLATTQGTSNLFEDDFETQGSGLISGNGWTNYIQEGTEGWESYTSSGSNPSLGKSARVGSYNSGDASSIAWLITPLIDFDAQEGETFVFKTSNSYSDGSNLELLYSTDWDGTEANITSATWGILPAAYLVQDGDPYGSWFDSGVVDLSCAEGSMYIAFKYTGSGNANFDGTYELDEISIDF